MVELREYQQAAIQRLRQSVAQGARRPLLTLPTGAGKTVLAAGMTASALERGSRVLFLAHRRELIDQTARQFHAAGIDTGILMAERPQKSAPVQVASIQTLQARLSKEHFHPPEADLVFVDEAHRAASMQYREILEGHYPDSVIVGLTATPVRSDGTGLGVVFDDLVIGPTVRELTDLGYLVPMRYWAPTIPDLTGVDTRKGDYVESQLEQAMDDKRLIGDIVSQWWRLASDRQTVVFASGVAHSRHLAQAFRDTGVAAEHIDGDTFKEERDHIIWRVQRGDVQVLCNCLVTTEGWDAPEVSCAVLARPTKSLGLYLQMAGRVLRPAPGKEDALLLDHSGSVHMHGFIDDDHPWALDAQDKIQRRQQKRDQTNTHKRITCGECGYVYQGRVVCPACGWAPPAKSQAPEVDEGDLAPVSGEEGQKRARKWTKADKQRWYSMLLGHARAKGYKDGWAAHKYREKVGVWPKGLNRTPDTPDGEVQGWIKHVQIRDRKRKEKAG